MSRLRAAPSRRRVLGGLAASVAGLSLPGCAPARPTAGEAPGVFRLPAEWEPHEACVMMFPTPQNWQGCWSGRCDWIDLARAEWAAVARAVAEFEPVRMYANEGEGELARSLCGSGVEVIEAPLNDAWARDAAPMVCVDGKGVRRAAGYQFNAWGEKFTPYDADAAFKKRVCRDLGVDLMTLEMVLEGGAITTDGEGTLITTEQCLLHPNRNPGWSRAEIEAALREGLGAETIVWLGEGLVPDPITDGHVDGICVFAAPGTVVVHTTDDTSGPNYAICQDALARLRDARDAKGRAFEIVELPLAGLVTHVNFYVANGGVVVPTNGDPATDDAALGILADVFPDRRVVGVTGTVMAEGGGGVHCITMQVPSAS